jgi:hypothetical protein
MEFLENSIQVKDNLIYVLKKGTSLHENVTWKKSFLEIFLNSFRRNYSYPYNDKLTGKSKNISKVPIEQVLLNCVDKDN